MEINIHCKFDEMLSLASLKKHPKNRNSHPQDQIERLAQLFEYHGIRHPIIVSNQTGFIVAGHCRKLSALRCGMKEFPVVYQNFKDMASEISFLNADNAVALWAELDIASINLDFKEIKIDFPDFNIDMMGIYNFTNEPKSVEKENKSKELDLDDFQDFKNKCPKCSFEWD